MPTGCYRFVTVLLRFCPFLLFFDIFSRDHLHFIYLLHFSSRFQIAIPKSAIPIKTEILPESHFKFSTVILLFAF